MNVYCEKFTLIFIIKLMKLSLKIEMSHFRVSDIVVTRRVVTEEVRTRGGCSIVGYYTTRCYVTHCHPAIDLVATMLSLRDREVLLGPHGGLQNVPTTGRHVTFFLRISSFFIIYY